MLTAADGKVVANNFYWIGASDNAYDFGKTTWYYTPVRKWSDLSFVFAHPEADVAMTVEATEDGYDVTLENRKETIVPQIVLKALDKDGNLAVPVYWSENFCPLLPNGTKTFHCRTEQKDLHFVISI
jgi:exo-1,4-beta-D-glucosaminidase